MDEPSLPEYRPSNRAVGVVVASLVLAVVFSPLVPLVVPLVVVLVVAAVFGVVAAAVRWWGDRELSGAVAVGGGLVVAGWLAPAYQPFVYDYTVANPGGLQWLVVGTALAAGFAALESRRDDAPTWRRTAALAALGFGVVGLVFVGPFVSDWYAREAVAQEMVTEAEVVDAPPESVVENSRIVPREVAHEWAVNSLQYPRYTLAGGDVTYIDGTPYWSWALAPDGPVNTLLGRQIGAVYVNQSSMEKNILIRDDTEFRYGQGMAVTDNYAWQVRQRDFFASYGEAFVVPHGNETYIAVPYSSHEWRFRATPVPQFYSVPRFAGVKLIDSDGAVTDLSPTEARESPVLTGQNFYPYSLARYRVESTSYRNGLLNTLLFHEDQIELADVPGEDNQQPFTVPTRDGPTYFVAAEPWGNANGVYQIWTVDARTGEATVTKLDKNSALRGPRKAVDAVMADPTLARLNDVEAVEPIPVVRDGTLYWEVRIVPESSARITYVAFFNADSEDVTVVETTSGVEAFLTGGAVEGPDGGGDGDDGTACGLRIQVEYPDGTTETQCVPEGSTVTVTRGNATGNATGRIPV